MLVEGKFHTAAESNVSTRTITREKNIAAVKVNSVLALPSVCEVIKARAKSVGKTTAAADQRYPVVQVSSRRSVENANALSNAYLA